MPKVIKPKVIKTFRTFLVMVLLSSSHFLFAQNDLEYYLDDNGYSEIKQELSIEFSQLLDLNLALGYQRYVNDKNAFNLEGSFRYGHLLRTNMMFLHSAFSLISDTPKVYSFSRILPSDIGFELSAGWTFYPKNDFRKNYIKLSLGYNYSKNKLDNQYAGFVGCNLGTKFINKPTYFLAFDFQTRFYFITGSYYGGVLMDFSLGYGLTAGIKI